MFWREGISKEAGPCPVLLKRGEFIDETRKALDGSGPRIVPYKIYHPEPSASLQAVPVILWSHGFGGNRDGAAFLSRYLASYGYAIVHMTHTGTDSSLWEGKPGHPWDILRETKVDRATSLARFRDVPFVLGALSGWAEENPDIGSVLNFEAIGMSGHSFGALSTQVAAGQLFPDESGALVSLKDPRIGAGILYSPVPVGHLFQEDGAHPPSIYRSMDVPLMQMTGTDDSSPIGGAPYTHRFVVFEEAGHPENYLLVKKDGDHMVYNGTRGKLEVNPKRDLHEEIIKAVSLAFWEAYLRQDQAALDWLRGDQARAYLSADAQLHIRA